MSDSENAQDVEYLDMDPDYMPVEQVETTQTDEMEDSDDHWSPSTIQILLKTYQQNIGRYQNSKMRKKTLWAEISRAVGNSPESCDKKFRNLKLTYLRLLRRKKNEGLTKFKWPYFGLFEKIYLVNGEYIPEIQEKLQEKSNSDTKSIFGVNVPLSNLRDSVLITNGESPLNVQNDEARKKMVRKKFTEFKKMATEMRDRQKTVEAKLDRLINIVEESNDIQRERNQLFQQYLESLHQNSH